jgi:hypothetical protein
MTRRRYAFLLGLLLSACGGEVTLDPGNGSSDPTSTPTKDEAGSGSGSRAGSGSASHEPTAPPNAAESKLPAGARFELAFDVLGAGLGDEDECYFAERTFDVNLALSEVSAKLCAKKPDGNVFETKTKSLSAAEVAAIQAEVDALRVIAMPIHCLYDGPAYGIRITGQSFIDQDYNCLHRTDVGYVTGLYKLDAVLKGLFGI